MSTISVAGRFKVYLAGGIDGRSGQEVRAERERAAQACRDKGLAFLDPAHTEDIPLGAKAVSTQHAYNTMKNFVSKDEYMISQCQALLVLTGDRPSDGTWWEMGLSHFKLRIPVVVVAPKRASGELMGFSNIKVDAIFATVEEAVEFIVGNYVVAAGGK